MAAEPPETANAGIDGFLEVLSDFPPGRSEGDLAAVRGAALGEAVRRMRARSAPSTIISEDAIERVIALLDGPAGDDRLGFLARTLEGESADRGMREVEEVLAALGAAGVPGDRIEFDPAMVRGLDYYTGTIFETVVTQPAVGSITGGGRFDALAGLFGRPLPAVGTSLGVDRLIDVMLEHSMFPDRIGRRTQVFVTRFDDQHAAESIRLGAQLRAAGISTEVHLGSGGLGDQIRLALRRGATLLLIAGPDEVATGTVAIRHLEQGEQSVVAAGDVVAAVGALLS
jgi:histidyl-tRNA synthetase